ncbi:unnamed protein product, partial [Porites lobata]
MASRKNNQETSKQSTLLRWVRPDREPWKTENRGEQAVLEETSQESDEQAAGTSNTSNSNINTTPQGPELPPTPDLPSVSKGPNQPKNFKFPQRTEINSNFYQLLKLRSEENPEISEWLSRRTEKYTSPIIQNEMLEVLALGVLREISENIQNAKFFTIMADETADVSIKEQLVVCIRWVDDKFVIHEDFIGMWPLPRTT